MSKAELKRLEELEIVRQELFVIDLDPKLDQTKQIAIRKKTLGVFSQIEKNFSRVVNDQRESERRVNQRLIETFHSINHLVRSLDHRSLSKSLLRVTRERSGKIDAEDLYDFEQMLHIWGSRCNPTTIEIRNTYNIYTGLTRKQNHLKSYQNIPQRNLEKSMAWKMMRRLAATFILLGLNTPTKKRMYIDGVHRIRTIRSERTDYTPPTVIASAKSFWFYLKYLKREWYEIHSPFEDSNGHRTFHYGNGYRKTKIQDALSLCKNLIYAAESTDDSRVGAEVPEALLGDDDMMTYYCWGSKYVRRLYREGVIKATWPDAHKALRKVFIQARKDEELRSMLKEIRKKSNRLWHQSSVPDIYSEDVDYICKCVDKSVADKVQTCLSV